MDDSFIHVINGSDDEDTALRRAIELSKGKSSSNYIDLTSEPDNEGEGHSKRTGHRSTLSDGESDSDDVLELALGSLTNKSRKGKSKEKLEKPSSKGKEKANFERPSSKGKEEMKPAKPSRKEKGKEKDSASIPTDQTVENAPPTPAGQPSSLKLLVDRKALEAERLARRLKQLGGLKEQVPDVEERNRTAIMLVQSIEQLAHATEQKRSAEEKRRLEPQSQLAEQSQPSQQRQAAKRKKEYTAASESESKGYAVDSGCDTSAPSDPSPPARRRKLETDIKPPVPRDPRPSTATGGDKSKGVRFQLATASPGPTINAEAQPTRVPLLHLPFAKGAVKKTWVRGQPHTGDDIRIDEIWKKDEMKLAVLSSFQWDEDWFLKLINLRKTKLVLIAYASDDKQKQEMRANVASEPNIDFCFPPMRMNGYMHSKLQILSFQDYIRIVVPTGNLVPYDWGETGGIENMVFLLDLPMLPYEYQNDANPTLTPFFEDLAYFLHQQGLPAVMVSSLRKYDFSETKRFAFVHSISGSHMDEAFFRTGYCGLGRAVTSLGLATSYPIQMDYLSSSLGSVNDGLLKALYYACQGDSGMKEFETRLPRGKAGQEPSSLRKHIRFYFPSEQTVANSIGGRNHAGTICFQSKWWHARDFPREVLRDVQSTRRGVLLHTKLLLVQPKPMAGMQQTNDDRNLPPAWAYVGSANVSESAWGHVVKDRASGKPKITCRNWECGVIVPTAHPPNMDPSTRQPRVEGPIGGFIGGAEGPSLLDVFRGTIPVPFSVPGASYTGKMPWFFTNQ